MELTSFALMIGIPLAWLMWGLTKKGYFASMAIPPMLFLFYAVFSLNTDPVLSTVQSDYVCVPLTYNATTAGNFTEYGAQAVCNRDTVEIPHALSPTALQIINYSMLLGLFSALFLVAKRIVEKVHNRGNLEE